MSHQIDLSYLIDITGGENDIMIEMIDIFLSESEVVIQNLSEHYQAGDYQKLGAEAHKLKPTLLYVGLKDLHETTQQLETHSKAGTNQESYEGWISEITSVYASIKGDLQKEKDRLLS